MPRRAELDKQFEDASLPQADRDFEAAARAEDFTGIEAALKAGADPNRVFSDAWSEHEGRRVLSFLRESSRRLDDPRPAQEFARQHASAMRALVEAGADFSLPSRVQRASLQSPFAPVGRDSYETAASKLWGAPNISIDSCVWLAKGGGDFSSVFGAGNGECPATHSRMNRRGSAEEILAPMWELAIEPLMTAGGGRLRLLTEALGSGLLEWAQWLIAKGARPAPIPGGSGALLMLATETIFFANPARAGLCSWQADGVTKSCAKARMLQDAPECARIAASFGEEPGPVLLGLLAQRGKPDPKASLAFAKTLSELGPVPLAGGEKNPFIAYAFADAPNAMAQLDFALGLGADPTDRSRQAASILLKYASPDEDEIAAQVIAKLVALGADLSEPDGLSKDESLIAQAVSGGLWASARALADAGLNPSWKDPATGDTLMAIAARWSVDCGRSGCATEFAQWLASRSAPMDATGSDQLAALHRAAKALDERLCLALLAAGADPNQPSADKAAQTPSHLACARYEKKKEKAQLKTIEALALHGADFSKLDGKGQSAFETASKKGFLSVLTSVAEKAKGVALEGDSGARAAKILAQRDGSLLAAVEEQELLTSSAPAPSAPAKKKTRGL